MAKGVTRAFDSAYPTVAYTKGKNATDSALVIDAMDLLYTRRFDGFCLVSSDSDFTRLASRLGEEGLTVYRLGEEKTPRPFVSACDKFIYTELLRSEVLVAVNNGHDRPDPEPSAEVESVKIASTPMVKRLPKASVTFIAKILDDIADEDGWAHLGALGTNISKLRPEFDPRTHGYKKLSELIKGYPDTFELQARGTTGVGGSILYARRRQASS